MQRAFGFYLLNLTAKLSLIFFGLAFIPIGGHNVILFSTLQSLVPEKFMGRVFSWFGSVAALFVPVGSFLGGILSSYTNVDNIYNLGSIGLLLIGLYWLIYPTLRKIPVPN